MEVTLKVSDDKYAEIEKFCSKNGMVVNHFLANALVTELDLQKKIRTAKNKAIREMKNEAIDKLDLSKEVKSPAKGTKKLTVGKLKRQAVVWLLDYYKSKYHKKMIFNNTDAGQVGFIVQKILSIENDFDTNKSLFMGVLKNGYANDFIKKNHLKPSLLYSNLNTLHQPNTTQTDSNKYNQEEEL